MTVLVAYLLFSLFITSARSSFIRQFTDVDFNKNLQEEKGARPNPYLEEGQYLHKHQEISSRDYTASASKRVEGLRDRAPSSYSLKMESFNTLLKSRYPTRYESRPFAVGGYNWTLVVYPKGNTKDRGSGYLSLYVAIDNLTLVAAHQEVYADLRFYIFNKNEKKYFTIQDTDVWKFSTFKTMWGISQALLIDTFKDPKNGYLYDGGHCEFGVDVTIPSLFEKSELFSINEKLQNPKFTWTIRGFSTLTKALVSDLFSIRGIKWDLTVFPNGRFEEGKDLAMYLNMDRNEKFRPYEKIYVLAKLRVLHQQQLSNAEIQLDIWYSGPGYGTFGWGGNVVSLADLRDSSKGSLVNDALIVQVEIEAISSTKYLPN
ncbi:hypothetical protein AALP_AA3G193700 [Arabis alpina]|uniref:MATH domain-containing protein n=1 Tax=Arabis alpina TaxID=50452 RepID=A0A087HA93_ARAAL|nr:hypothetical protein AALP_AA3G193700 [Arabis alpina]